MATSNWRELFTGPNASAEQSPRADTPIGRLLRALLARPAPHTRRNTPAAQRRPSLDDFRRRW